MRLPIIALLVTSVLTLSGCIDRYNAVPPESVIPITANGNVKIAFAETVVATECSTAFAYNCGEFQRWQGCSSVGSSPVTLHRTPPENPRAWDVYFAPGELRKALSLSLQSASYNVVADGADLVIQPRITKFMVIGCFWRHGDHHHSSTYPSISVEWTVRKADTGAVIFKAAYDGADHIKPHRTDKTAPENFTAALFGAAVESSRRLMADPAFHRIADAKPAT